MTMNAAPHGRRLPAVPGGLLILLAMIAAVAVWIAPEAAPPRDGWLRTWIAASAGAAVAAAIALALRARRNGTSPFAPHLLHGALRLLAPVFAAGVLTELLYAYARDESFGGLWALCYGAGVVAASAGVSRWLTLMGVAFMGLGVWGLIGLRTYGLVPIPETNLTPPDVLLALSFCGVHLLFGIVRVIAEIRLTRRGSAA